MRGCGRNRSVARMLPVLRLSLLTLAILLSPPPPLRRRRACPWRSPPRARWPSPSRSGAKSVKVKSAPAGVTVAGGVKKGRLAVAVLRPRGVAAKGKVVLTLKGRPRASRRSPPRWTPGRVSAGCGDLGGLLGKRLKGTADVKALGARAGREAVREDARRRTPPTCSPSSASAPRPRRRRPAPASGGGPSPRPAPASAAAGDGDAGPHRHRRRRRPPAGKRACDNKLDDDGDGQTDWEDPGCSDAGDMTENSEVPVSAACAATSGIGMGDDPTELTVGINPECGLFWEAEVQVAPGVASRAPPTTTTSAWSTTRSPPRTSYDGQRDAVDMTLQLKARSTAPRRRRSPCTGSTARTCP